MKPPVFLRSGQPIAILGACKEAALEADWLLSRWEEFRRTAEACLTADALPEEYECFLRVVEERFEVTRGPKFQEWSPTSKEQS